MVDLMVQNLNKSVYIHIPFCKSICTYCDFCKFYYNENWVKSYLIELEKEIDSKYNGEVINTIYIGGGTPSCLNIEQLNTLFSITKKFIKSSNIEFTFECNIESINEKKLKFLYLNGVNRLSIGVQTFNANFLRLLNRNHNRKEVFNKIKLAKKIGFKNISIDLIYAIPNQTLDELNKDLDEFLKLDINHISTYSLILEPNTKLYIDKVNNIDDDLDLNMYNLICKKLKDNGFYHYEISNFSKPGYESRHNLTYWDNDEYYGFGLGASGYINQIRYENTRSINKYLKNQYIFNSHKLDRQEIIENEFILGLRKISGIEKDKFRKKYGIDLKEIDIVKKLLKENKLLENKKSIYINPIYIYISNDILLNFIDNTF